MPHCMRLAAGQDDVEVAQGIAVGRDHHARAAALPVGRKHGQHAVLGLAHRRRSAAPRPRGRAAARLGRRASQTWRRQARNRQCAMSHDVPVDTLHLPSLALHKQEVVAGVQAVGEIDQDRQTPHARQTSTSTVRGASLPAITASNSTLSSPRTDSRTLPLGRTASSIPTTAWKRLNAAGQAIDEFGAGCGAPIPCVLGAGQRATGRRRIRGRSAERRTAPSPAAASRCRSRASRPRTRASGRSGRRACRRKSRSARPCSTGLETESPAGVVHCSFSARPSDWTDHCEPAASVIRQMAGGSSSATPW